jgi:hypothetical protein
MSWRRRLLGTSALIGASVLCLRPVLNNGIERRLSEQLQLPVSIEATHLAMSQNSLQLFWFQIDDEHCPFSIEELSLRLDGNALLYRDCVVESFVGYGLKWFLPKPADKANVNVIPTVTSQSNSTVKDIQDIFSQTLQSIKEAESLSLDRSREIDLKLKSVQSKIDELIYQHPAPNPLRNSQSSEKLRSDLIAIQSLLASDRVESSKMDSATNRSLDQLNATLEFAKKNSPNPSTTSDEITKVILENAIRSASERIRPYTIAAEASYLRFLKQLPIEERSETVTPEDVALIRPGRELVTDKIPEREFVLRRGRVTGQSTVGETSLPTEILISSIRVKRQDANILQISWKSPGPTAPETTCKIGPSLGVDNSVSHLLNLVQKDEECEIALQVNYRPTTRDISISFPLKEILDDNLGVDPELIAALRGVCEKQNIELLASTHCPLEMPTIDDSITWIVADEVNAKIQAAIDEAMALYITARQEAWLHQTQSEYASSKNLLESRKLAIAEERNFRHTTWSDTLKAMESKLRSIDRAARNAMPSESSLVR